MRRIATKIILIILFFCTYMPYSEAQTQKKYFIEAFLGAYQSSTPISDATSPANPLTLNIVNPYQITTDNSGNIYVAERGAGGTGHRIRKYDAATHSVTIVAGSGLTSPNNMTDGMFATSANITFPSGLAVSPDNKWLYFTEGTKHTIRRILIDASDATNVGKMELVAGTYNNSGAIDGNGDIARFNKPEGIYFDQSGNLYVADFVNGRVRKISGLNSSFGAATNRSGLTVTTIIGAAAGDPSTNGISPLSASLQGVFSIAIDNNSNIYFTEQITGRIRMLSVNTQTINGIPYDKDKLYIIAGNGTLANSVEGQGALTSSINEPRGLYVYNTNTNTVNIFFCEYGAQKIIKLDGADNKLYNIAGTENNSGYSGNNGLATAALINHPTHILFSNGIGYFSDADNNTIRALTSCKLNKSTYSNTCLGFNAYFHVYTPITVTSYNWYDFNNGSPQTLLQTTETCTIANVNTSQNLKAYYCVAITPDCGNVTSTIFTLTVTPLPSILVNPTTYTICPNSNANFSITASGTTLLYQWQQKLLGFSTFSDIPGANSSAYTVSNVGTAYNGFQYKCRISEQCGSSTSAWVDSNSATLNVPNENAPNIIQAPPPNVSVCAQASLNLALTGTGGGLSYHWEIETVANNSTYTSTGNNSSTLSSLANIADDSKRIRCILTNSCGTYTSTLVALSVKESPSQLSYSGDITLCATQSGMFSVTFTAPSSGSLTYRWEVDQNNGQGFQSAPPNYTLQSYAINSALISQNGFNYRCIGIFTNQCTATSTSMRLGVSNALAFTQQPPPSVLGCTNQTTTIGIVATGDNVNYQWYYSTDNGASYLPVAGTSTNTLLTLPNITLSQANYRYKCQISNGCGSNTSTIATLNVQETPTITTQPQNQVICAGASITFTLNANGMGVISCQWQQKLNNSPIFQNVSNQFNYNISNVSSDLNQSQYLAIATSNGCSVTSTIASLTVNSSATITLQPNITNTKCTGNNCVLKIEGQGSITGYQWYIKTPSSGSFVAIAGAIAAIYTATNVNTPTYNNSQFKCEVSNLCSSSVTSTIATLFVHDIPSITTNPVDVSVCPNGLSSFFITASSTSGDILSYQWQQKSPSDSQFNTLTGYTLPTLTFNSTQSQVNNYAYVCRVFDTFGCENYSSSATIHIKSAPVIQTQPQAIATCKTQDAELEVIAAGSNLTYQWQKNSPSTSSYQNLTETTKFQNTTSRKLKITSLVPVSDEQNFLCIITDGVSLCSTTSLLTQQLVNTPPTIISNTLSPTTCPNSPVKLSVVATGTGLIYEWLENFNGTWASIGTNSNLYQGMNSPDLIIPDAQTGMNNYLYQCRIKGTCDNVGTNSSVITLTVKEGIKTLPVIQSDIKSKLIETNVSINFSITTNTTTENYQWFRNGISLTNGTSSNLTIKESNAGSIFFKIKVTNVISGCSVSSNNYTVTIINPAKLSASINYNNYTKICKGDSLKLHANNDPYLNWKWYKNGNIIPNAQDSVYVVKENGYYELVVKNANNEEAKSKIGVNILVQDPPQIIIKSLSGKLGVAAGNSISLIATGGFTYKWLPAEGIPNGSNNNILSVVPTKTTTYTVIGKDGLGCTNTATIAVKIFEDNYLDKLLSNEVLFKPPLLFTPYVNDGFNDVFKIDVLDEQFESFCELTVLNVWGKIVYYNSLYHNEWDFSYRNEKLPPGLYYYKATTKLKEGKEKLYIGYFNLLESSTR